MKYPEIIDTVRFQLQEFADFLRDVEEFHIVPKDDVENMHMKLTGKQMLREGFDEKPMASSDESFLVWRVFALMNLSRIVAETLSSWNGKGDS